MIQAVQDLLEASFAHSSACQSFLGASTEAEARDRIHHDALPEPSGDRYTRQEMESLRPCVLIAMERYTRQKRAMGLGTGDSCWQVQGALVARLYRTVPSTESLAASDAAMRASVEAIVADLEDQSETGGRLAATSIDIQGPSRIEQKDVKNIGEEQMMQLTIGFGSDRQ